MQFACTVSHGELEGSALDTGIGGVDIDVV